MEVGIALLAVPKSSYDIIANEHMLQLKFKIPHNSICDDKENVYNDLTCIQCAIITKSIFQLISKES